MSSKEGNSKSKKRKGGVSGIREGAEVNRKRETRGFLKLKKRKILEQRIRKKSERRNLVDFWVFKRERRRRVRRGERRELSQL